MALKIDQTAIVNAPKMVATESSNVRVIGSYVDFDKTFAVGVVAFEAADETDILIESWAIKGDSYLQKMNESVENETLGHAFSQGVKGFIEFLILNSSIKDALIESGDMKILPCDISAVFGNIF